MKSEKIVTKRKKLTSKQRKWRAAYCGNATEAARIAGYANPRQAGARMLSDAVVMAGIKEREEKRENLLIATREKRQAFWTRVMMGLDVQKVVIGSGERRQVVEIPPKMSDRLKASELLGKSEADFIERRREEGELTVKIVRYCDETAKYLTP